MKHYEFLKLFIRSPKQIGALLPDSHYCVQKLIAGINFAHAHVIVEWGCGTGTVTKAILKRKHPETVYICVEKSQLLLQRIQRSLKALPENTNTHFFHADFRLTPSILRQLHLPSANALISTLPLSFLPTDTLFHVAAASSHYYTQYMYITAPLIAGWPYPQLKQWFAQTSLRFCLRNVPPCFIFDAHESNVLSPRQSR